MKKGFYTIMAAQFFSSLADNALLIAAIALLDAKHAPGWMTPMLKLFFVLSYVVLAAFVGNFVDSMPKGRAMFITNGIKIVGCGLMLSGVHPLLAYGIVGFGAAAYSPAKYGILTELLPPGQLVAANGWIEGTTVASIIFGTVLGGALISPYWVEIFSPFLTFLSWLHIPTLSSYAKSAIVVVVGIYLLAGLFNLAIPDTGARYTKQRRAPIHMVSDFYSAFLALWRDPLGQLSLSVTTLFWGAGATLQFIILKWAEHSLGMSLSQSAVLQAMVAIGIAAGAIFAATRIPLHRSLKVLPAGFLAGIAVIAMSFYTSRLFPGHWSVQIAGFSLPIPILIADALLIAIGALCGFFVVPMNALLQHRGHLLLSSGHSIAVQNFNENLSVIVMLCVYSLLVWLDIPITAIMVLLGVFVLLVMACVIRVHQINQRRNQRLLSKTKEPRRTPSGL